MSAGPDGYFNAPPYVEGRYVITAGGVSSDVASIRHPDTWNRAFGSEPPNWETGWRSLWTCAAGTLGTGSDYTPGRVAVEIELYFGDNTQTSAGFHVECDIEDMEWEERAIAWIGSACGNDDPIAGCVGVVVDEEDALARPCLTMLVSGPGGAAQAAMMIRQALANRGVNAGITVRTIRRDLTGVVKVPFLPELYLLAGHPSCAVDWQRWARAARDAAPLEWGSAALVWCDALIAAGAGARTAAPLMVDEVYFDFMRTVPIFSGVAARGLLYRPRYLSALMSQAPHAFLFGQR